MERRIRKATVRDIPDLCRLMALFGGRSITPEEMAGRLKMVRRSAIDELFVMTLNSRVSGVLGFRIRENIEAPSRYGEISLIAVDPDVRRQGIGRDLVQFAESHAKALGCIGTWLVSGLGREREAHRFYRQMGYRATGYRFVKCPPASNAKKQSRNTRKPS